MRVSVVLATVFTWVVGIHGANTATGTQPYVVVWSPESYGPDGPWHAVTVEVAGTPIDLFPSGIWETIILDNAIGADYIPSGSVVYDFTDTTEALGRWGSGAAMNISGKGSNIFDTLNLKTTLQGSTNIYNCTLFAASALNASLPNGTSYPLTVGSLSLGAWLGVQTWGKYQGLTIPSYLKGTDRTTSSSFGLHYGSALLGLEGSLVFGGYDQNRVLGDVGSFDLGINGSMALKLMDIEIGVESGASPFNVTSASGLLKLDASEKSIPTTINPLVPYFFLPAETCAALAEFLPVVLDPRIGLYIWNTDDPAYQSIISAPTYLNFIFQSAGTSGGNLSIKVPLQLLNLTLEKPIISAPTQYFPCRPYEPEQPTQDPYLLGKAFLQAAFIGMNWELRKFFLAQAPGPGVGPSQIQEIGPDANKIASNSISDFSTTWAGKWAPMSDSEASKPPTTNVHTGSLGGGAKAGMAIGIVVALIAIATVFLFFFLRRRRRIRAQHHVINQSESDHVLNAMTTSGAHEIGFQEPKEVGEDQAHEIGESEVHELNEGKTIHELESPSR